MQPMSVAQTTDDMLIAQCLEGSREAFGQIVARYQSLICSMAYSATGSLGQSEDLAQETFITAWKHLRLLREPSKLRAWLCGIARNRINYSLRREGRRPLTHAEPLEAIPEAAAIEPLPNEHAITREEEAILWRALETVPETYREPLVLFYRQGKSIEAVARDLELSEDAVKQRLSRGRRLLQEQVLAFVEGALARTSPGKAFTLGVVAALPLMAVSASAGTVGATVAKGTAAAKAMAFSGLFGAVAGPVIGLLGGIIGTRISIANTQSARERQFVVRLSWKIWALVIAFSAGMMSFVLLSRNSWQTHALALTLSLVGMVFVYLVALLSLVFWSSREQRRIRSEEAAKLPRSTALMAKPYSFRPFEYRSSATLLGLPLVHVRMECTEERRTLAAKGWIAIGNIAYGALFACGGLAVAPISLGGAAVGVLALGGCGLGFLCFAGVALGYWAVGGMAVGYMAFGGAAVGWLASEGGAAVAHHFALGGSAIAEHANDAAARSFFRTENFFLLAKAAAERASLLIWLPIGLAAWQLTRIRRNLPRR